MDGFASCSFAEADTASNTDTIVALMAANRQDKGRHGAGVQGAYVARLCSISAAEGCFVDHGLPFPVHKGLC